MLHLTYADEAGSENERDIEPLCLAFWGGKWTLGARCRLRREFRNFRLDRMRECITRDAHFTDSPQRNLKANSASMGRAPEDMH